MPPLENENDDAWMGLYGLSISDDDDDNGSRPTPVPLTGVQVQATVHDFIAEIKVEQSYHNTSTKPIEAIYHFPLEDGAAVCGFTATYPDGSVVQGVVQEKQQAKQAYEQAKQQGKQANLLTAVRRDVWTLSVGNLVADGRVNISLAYVTTLQARNGSATALVLPTSIAPRFTPSTSSSRDTMTTPMEADAMAPPTVSAGATSPFANLYGLNIAMQVHCRSPIKSITSPTHPNDVVILSTANNQKTQKVQLDNITMNGDVVIHIEEQTPHQPRASLEVAADGTTTGLVTFFPKVQFRDKPNQEFVFVVDQSGSMTGPKMQQAREALLLFLRALPLGCCFQIVGFGSRFRTLFPNGPQPYNDTTLQQASDYASTMEANMGGTNILTPLAQIFGEATDRDRQILVLTDGQVSNDTQVFDAIRTNCSARSARHRPCRLFSLGIGSSVSRHLVNGMARAGRGTARFVEEGSPHALRARVMGQLKQAMQPSLENVSIEWKFPAQETKLVAPSVREPERTLLGYRSPSVDQPAPPAPPKMYPSVNPRIFNEEKYLSYAMFPEGSPKPIGVTVKCSTMDGPLELSLDITEDEIYAGAIARKLAARVAITEYEDGRLNRYQRAGIVSADQALQLALANSLASQQTSFVAIAQDAVLEPGATVETTVIPQHAPRDERWSPGYSSFAGSAPAPVFACHKRMAKKKSHRKACLFEKSRFASNDAFYGNMLRGSAGVARSSRFASASADNVIAREFAGREKAMLRMGPRVKGPARAPTERSAFDDGDDMEMARATAADTRAPPGDKMLQLCLLQKANGSFLLNDALFSAIESVPRENLEAIRQRMNLPVSPDADLALATALAVVVLRLAFLKQRSTWELQEQKGLAFLSSQGSSVDLNVLKTAVESFFGN